MRFRIRPTWTQCKLCKETTASFNNEPPCNSCNTDVYEMLKLEKDYVYYVDRGDIKKIHIDYVKVLGE